MNDRASRFTSQHLIGLVVIAVVVVCVAVLAGAGSGSVLILVMCAGMMGAMMWMLMGGMSGRDRG